MSPSASGAPRPPAGVKIKLGFLLLLAGLTAFAPLSIDMYLPALPQMARDLHAPAAAGALTVAAFYIGLCLGQLVHGPLSDRVGRRPPLVAGIAIYVVASIGAALAGSVEMLIAMRFLEALGGCAGLVVGRAVVRDSFTPEDSAHVFSLLLLVMSLAPVIAPLLGSLVLLVAGWRTIFWILVGFGSIVWIGTMFRLKETRSIETAAHARAESPLRSYAAILTERQVMGYALAAGCSHMGLLTYLAIAPEVIITGFGVSPQHFGWVIAVNGIGLVAANAFNRKLLRRWRYDQILRRANGVSIGASVLLALAAYTGFGGFWGVTIPLFVIVGLIGFTQPNAFAGAMAHDPRRAGAVSALVGCLQFGLGAAGSSIAGLLHDGTARPMATIILIAFVTAGLFLRLLAKD